MKESLIKDLSKRYPNSKVMSGDKATDVDFITTGSANLDEILGGGFIKGRFHEIFGKEGCGKTCICLLAMKELMEAGGSVCFVDCERTFDKRQAMTLGIDVSKMGYIIANSGEDAINMVRDMSKAGVDLIIIDSLAAMVPNYINEKDLGQSPMALHARLLTTFFQGCVNVIADNGTTVLCINQERAQMDAFAGGPKTAGGYALKYYVSQRVQMLKPDRKGKKDGMTIKYKVYKNKSGEIEGKGETEVMREGGIDEATNTIMKALSAGIVQFNKGRYEYEGKKYRLNKFTEDMIEEINGLLETINSPGNGE